MDVLTISLHDFLVNFAACAEQHPVVYEQHNSSYYLGTLRAKTLQNLFGGRACPLEMAGYCITGETQSFTYLGIDLDANVWNSRDVVGGMIMRAADNRERESSFCWDERESVWRAVLLKLAGLDDMLKHEHAKDQG
jgi:hypothetical protein